MAFPWKDRGRPIEHEPPVQAIVKASPPAAGLPERASKNDVVAALPRRRYAPEFGALYLMASGLVVTPLEQTSPHSWNVRVIIGNDRYPAGGYDLSVGSGELEVSRQIVLELQPETP